MHTDVKRGADGTRKQEPGMGRASKHHQKHRRDAGTACYTVPPWCDTSDLNEQLRKTQQRFWGFGAAEGRPPTGNDGCSQSRPLCCAVWGFRERGTIRQQGCGTYRWGGTQRAPCEEENGWAAGIHQRGVKTLNCRGTITISPSPLRIP